MDQGQRCKGRHAKPGMLLWGTSAAHLHVVFPGCRHVSTARRLQNKQALGACTSTWIKVSDAGVGMPNLECFCGERLQPTSTWCSLGVDMCLQRGGCKTNRHLVPARAISRTRGNYLVFEYIRFSGDGRRVQCLMCRIRLLFIRQESQTFSQRD